MRRQDGRRLLSLRLNVGKRTANSFFKMVADVVLRAAAPLPRFDGQQSLSMSTQSTGAPVVSSPSGPPPIRVPALTLEKVNQYSALFDTMDAENGNLSGAIAKPLFERAGLPNEVLGRIWSLSDIHGRGSLDCTEFVIAMHLLSSYKSGAMRGVPNSLPPGLYEAASRRRPTSFPRPGSATGVPTQFTGSSAVRPQSPLTRQQAGTPLSTQSTGDTWAISPVDKARFDQRFATLDKSNRGYIDGDQAVEFFGNARLPEETLAQIWDLADIDSDGLLTRDEFAVAMYLIRQQMVSKDGRGNLPSTLPPALVPPSMRRQQMPPPQPTAPAFANAAATAPKSAADDLFGLDVFAASPSGPAKPAQQVAQSTGASDAGPFANPPAIVPAVPAAVASPATTFKPFVPSSSFGQSIVSRPTESPSPQQTRDIPQAPTSDDLLGDADPEVSQRLTNETSELANLSNQVGNLSKQMTEVQASRGQTERELAQSSQQKRDFEARLGQLRAQYEQEVKDVKSLQAQLTASKNDTKRLQQDMAMIEGTHHDLRTQHQQLTVALQTDQQENATLKDKIRQMNAEIEQLRPQLEKIKSEARQQKGLVAINRKQLATIEAERDRIRAEMATAVQEKENAMKELEESSRQVESSQKELEDAKSSSAALVKSHSNVASPAPSTISNPFFKRTASAVFSPPITDHDSTAERNNAFDSIFGTSYSSSTPSAPPPTSFKTETPVQTRVASGFTDLGRVDSPSSSSVVTDAIEPPAPPQSRQITSASLPFRTPLTRPESVSSSVKVALPVSRASPSGTPRALTPPESASASGQDERQVSDDHDPFGPSTPTKPGPASEIFAPDSSIAPSQEAQQSTEQASESNDQSQIPGEFPTETPRSEAPESSIAPEAVALGAGAATVAAGLGIAAVATHEEEKDKGPEDTAKPTTAEEQTNFDDYFGGPAHQRSRSEQVADFDEAFEGMRKGTTANGTATGNKEFPPIQELGGDDSSSYTDETPMGFDDDFNAKPPELPPKESAPAPPAKDAQPEVASAVPNHLSIPRPPFESSSSTASSLPGIESQTSPPTYKDSVPGDDPTHFPPEFKGLLPAREDPTSPPAGGSSMPAGTPAGEPPLYGPEVSKSPSASQSTPLAPPAKTSPFDFDTAFADVTPAQVEEDDEEEAFTPGKNLGAEFDPTFESPSHSRTTTAASNAALPTSVYAAVTNGPERTNNAKPSTVTDDFYNFDNAFSATQAPVSQTSGAVGNASASSHDWDSMFAGLDANPSPSINDLSSQKQETQVGDSATAASSVAPVQPSPSPEPKMASPSRPTQSPQQSPERPQFGRALTLGTEHDDPILKRLTAMGWSREESLKALEQFDYNIDKVSKILYLNPRLADLLFGTLTLPLNDLLLTFVFRLRII